VRGTLFVDYVRMLRARKGVSWSRHLEPSDLGFLGGQIEPEQWYPMESFERMGLAILTEIAGGDMPSVKEWGRSSIDGLRVTHPELVTVGDARESLMKFHVLRTGFFDFPALTMNDINDGEASLEIAYGMRSLAEEAASNQTLGFFERLLEVSGARNPSVWFASRSWTGAPATLLVMSWE
jgi:hypothetical protein